MSALTTALAAQSHFISPEAAALYLGTTPGTLATNRSTGLNNPPPFWKTSAAKLAHVRYRYDELDLWLAGKWTGPKCRVMGQAA